MYLVWRTSEYCLLASKMGKLIYVEWVLCFFWEGEDSYQRRYDDTIIPNSLYPFGTLLCYVGENRKHKGLRVHE